TPSLVYPLSLHDALPISPLLQNLPPNLIKLKLNAHFSLHSLTFDVTCINTLPRSLQVLTLPYRHDRMRNLFTALPFAPLATTTRSEEHTSELQSRENLVC